MIFQATTKQKKEKVLLPTSSLQTLRSTYINKTVSETKVVFLFNPVPKMQWVSKPKTMYQHLISIFKIKNSKINK
jgi:hypothetical protein